MPENFFPNPDSQPVMDAPPEAPVVKTDEVAPAEVKKEPAPIVDAPALPTIEGATAASDIARKAHKRLRRTAMLITISVIFAVILLIWLIVKLVSSPTAPTSSNSNPSTNSGTTSVDNETPKPTVDSELPGSNSSSAGTAGWPAMTVDFVKNQTYPTPESWTSVNLWKNVPPRFTLSKGLSSFEAGWYQIDKNSERVKVRVSVFVKDEAIGTGDIDGDGLADALALLKWTDGGTGSWPLLYTIYGNQPYTPMLNNDVIANVIGGSYSATKISLSNNSANLELKYPKAGDASCCWTGLANINLTLKDGQWQIK